MNNIKFFRFFAGLSQWALGKKAQLSQTKISLIEQEYIQPSVEEKRRIAKVLGKKIQEVFPDEKVETCVEELVGQHLT